MKITLLTSLELIYTHKACRRGVDTFLASLNEGQRSDKYRQINILDILESNGVVDFLWTFVCTTSKDETVKKTILGELLLSIRSANLELYPNDSDVDRLCKDLKRPWPLTRRGIIYCASIIRFATEYKNVEERKVMTDKQIYIIKQYLE